MHMLTEEVIVTVVSGSSNIIVHVNVNVSVSLKA